MLSMSPLNIMKVAKRIWCFLLGKPPTSSNRSFSCLSEGLVYRAALEIQPWRFGLVIVIRKDQKTPCRNIILSGQTFSQQMYNWRSRGSSKLSRVTNPVCQNYWDDSSCWKDSRSQMLWLKRIKIDLFLVDLVRDVHHVLRLCWDVFWTWFDELEQIFHKGTERALDIKGFEVRSPHL